MKIKILYILCSILIPTIMFSQNVGIGTDKPVKSALLDLSATDKGFLLPRLTENQKNLIPNPVNGLMIYQKDKNSGIYFYNEGSWRSVNVINVTSALDLNNIPKDNGSGTLISSNLYSVGSSVGIGTASPNISGFGNALTLKSPSGYTGFEMFGATTTTGGQLDFGGGNVRYATLVGEYSSSNNGQLLIRTLNNGNIQEALRVTSKGDIGIGTNSPNISNFGRALTLKSASNYVGFEMFGATSTTGGQLDFGGGNVRYATLVGEFSSSNNGQILIRTLNNGQMEEGLRITSKGNLGIGTSSPNISNYGRAITLTAPSGYAGFEMFGATSTSGAQLDFGGGSQRYAALVGEFSSSNNGQLTFRVLRNGNMIEGMKITSGGNLVIGDSQMNVPLGYKLVVQDGIITEKLKIALRNSSDWADYVFDKNYKLKTISELSDFIKSNHHLPNVPSAEEMANNGLDVKEASRIFMEKIEELTLYIIQLNHQIQELKKINHAN